MKILIDMNLSPNWCAVFRAEGWEAIHWSEVGDYTASDEAIMSWAREREFIVFTHDLDFSTLLALTKDASPSVIQMRTQDVLPSSHAQLVIRSIKRYQEALQEGAILTIDIARQRVRRLPLR
jgi:predicted nuclease of predicted toxin-antitoxin system